MDDWTTLHDQFILSKRARADSKTVDWYEARLRHWLAFAAEIELRPKKIRTEHLDQFAGRLKALGLAYSTREGTLTALKGFLRWCRKRKAMKRDPFADFEPLRKERSVVQPISTRYALTMIHEAETSPGLRAIRDAAIMRLLLTTGARREEIVNLRLPAIDLVGDEITLHGKFDHQRRAFLIPTARSALQRWLDHRPDELDHDFVFVATRARDGYRPLRPDAVNQTLTHWRDQAGLPAISVSPHKWRHRFATDLAKGRNPFGLQLLLGHADIAVSSVYVQSHPDDLRALVLRYAPGRE